MPCYYPIRMKQLTKVNSNGNRSIVSWTHHLPGKSIDLPCGRCVGCRLERSRQWAVRCVHEMSLWRNNSFITLTYADDALTFGGAQHGILNRRDLTLFWKRLRKSGVKFRYFACGEYGDESNRPHYHAIIFGYDFPDKTYHHTEDNYDLYTSATLDRLWGHGSCLIGDATFESASYVARYVMKKRLGKTSEEYEKEGITPEFVVMSRNPGIGGEWYDKYESDVFPRDNISVRGHDSVPPKYYTRRFEAASLDLKNPNVHPMDFQAMKERRKERAQANWEQNEPKQLKVREHVKFASIRKISRKKV